MSLYRRGEYYWTYVRIRGQRYGKSTKTSDRRKAERINAQFKQELLESNFQTPRLDPQMSFTVLAAKFLADSVPKDYHAYHLKRLLPFYGEVSLGNISKNSTRQFREYRQGGRKKKLSLATVNRDLEVLRHVLNWAVDEGFLAKNPLGRLKLERERKKKRPILSIIEEELLLNAAAPHLKDLIVAALNTGMRRGELLHQQWQDLDFARKVLFVSRSKTPEGEAREIPLSSIALRLFWEKRENEGLVFTFKEKPIHRIKTAWKAAIRRSGIRYLRFHDLRHTFATRLMEAGVMQEVRKSLLGHSSGEDVHAAYVHVELPVKRDAIAKLEKWRWEQEQLVLEGKKGEKGE